MNITIGKKIRVLRTLRDMTQTELATEIGMQQYDITALEKDRFQPGANVMAGIERALGCRLDADITITGDGRLVCIAPVQEVA